MHVTHGRASFVELPQFFVGAKDIAGCLGRQTQLIAAISEGGCRLVSISKLLKVLLRPAGLWTGLTRPLLSKVLL